MKTIILVSLFLLSASQVLAEIAPLKSKQDISFTAKTERKFLDLQKNEDFAGVITRNYETSRDLRLVDLYIFKDVAKISMDEDLCKQFLTKIYGPLDKITLKTRKIQIYSTKTGKACEAQLDDEDTQAKIPERRTIVGFINAKPYAIVFRLSKKSTPDVQEDIKKFWSDLR